MFPLKTHISKILPKSYLIDTLAGVSFWTLIWFLLYHYWYHLPLPQTFDLLIGSAVMNALLGGIFGLYLNKIRHITNSHS